MLQVIANGKKVSVAWVIRDAIEKYIDAEAEKGKQKSGKAAK
jgi:predicted transcriptional regulator